MCSSDNDFDSRVTNIIKSYDLDFEEESLRIGRIAVLQILKVTIFIIYFHHNLCHGSIVFYVRLIIFLPHYEVHRHFLNHLTVIKPAGKNVHRIKFSKIGDSYAVKCSQSGEQSHESGYEHIKLTYVKINSYRPRLGTNRLPLLTLVGQPHFAQSYWRICWEEIIQNHSCYKIKRDH